MNKRWELPKTAGGAAGLISQKPEVHPLVLGILAARGCTTPDEIRTFLSPALSDMLDPFHLHGMDMAVARLMEARRAKEKVCVYGDYDALLR